MPSLWGEDFNEEANTKNLLSKINTPKEMKIESAIKSKKIPIKDKMDLIADNVYRILGVYKENTTVIKTVDDFKNYIDIAIKNGVIAIDTETNNSLDPLTCKIVGLCLYTPYMKNAYIPINHTDMSGNRLDWQCTEQDIKEQISRVESIKTIYHNGSFDKQVIYCTCGINPTVYWDTMIGARLLNENEKAGLKYQYISKIDQSIEKYSIEHLFGEIPYELFDPELFALYAATDSFMTYKLYEYQLEEFEKSENTNLYKLFREVEMPILAVASDMELTGVCIDKDYADRLSKKYHKKLDEIDNKVLRELDNLKDKIDEWSRTPDATRKEMKNGKLQKSKLEQLETPINLSSPTQMAILFYDILKSPVIDSERPRGTGEDIIKQMDFPIVKLLLERRSLNVLINTFIDKLPNAVNPSDGRLHGHFNQLGTDTGRFSSTDPNLQNIPSNETSVRLMFKASPGYVMIGSDYSAQEPRIMAAYSKDPYLAKSLEEGKDPYAVIATKIYHNNYEDNLEEYPDGTLYLEGKHRRKSVKSLLLGILYGMQVPAIAEKMNLSIQEAQKILEDFFTGFPGIKKWIDETESNAKRFGYVEDLWGRRRRLPDILLPKYTIKSNKIKFNPLIGSSGNLNDEKEIEQYRTQLNNCKSRRDEKNIVEVAKLNGYTITNNNGFISRAERQCVNARIQGGAATMTKKAMLLIHNDEKMKEYGFRLLLAVHDELIGEAPIEYKEQARERLSYLMRIAARPECMVTMKCDALTFPCWYWDVRSEEVRESYAKYIKDTNCDEILSMKYLKEDYSELSNEQIDDILFDKCV